MTQQTRAEQQIGSILPDVALEDVSDPNRIWRLRERAADGIGAAVVFWSSVCSHCERYDGYLNAFATRHPDLAFAAIASRQNETADDIRTALAARRLTFTTIYDPGSAVAHLLFTQHTPRVFLVDREGRLVYRGAIDNFKYPDDPDYDAYLEPAIDALRAGQPVARPETPSFGCSIQSVYYTIHRPLGAKLLPVRNS